MTKEELKKESFEIKDPTALVNVFGIITIASKGVFFSKSSHKKLVNYIDGYSSNLNKNDEESKVQFMKDVILFGIDHIDLHQDVFEEAFKKIVYFNIGIDSVGSYIETKVFYDLKES